jgi:hypothetical protein
MELSKRSHGCVARPREIADGACGEFWQLDATTRKMLSLPLRSNSRSEENGRSPASFGSIDPGAT